MEMGLKPYEPQRLNTRHMQILLLTASGLKGVEIAEIMDMSQSRISVIKNTPQAGAIIARLRGELQRGYIQDIKGAITSYTGEAVERIADLMRGENESVALSAAKDILDRGGYKPREVTVAAQVNIDSKQAEQLMNALVEGRRPEEELVYIQDSSKALGTTDGEELESVGERSRALKDGGP